MFFSVECIYDAAIDSDFNLWMIIPDDKPPES